MLYLCITTLQRQLFFLQLSGSKAISTCELPCELPPSPAYLIDSQESVRLAWFGRTGDEDCVEDLSQDVSGQFVDGSFGVG